MQKAEKQLKRLRKLKGKGATQEIAKEIYEESQRNVPVDRGELRDSGRYDEEEVVYTADHAIHVEFGTATQSPQSFLRTAIDDVDMRLVAEEVEKEIRKLIR